MFRKLPTNAKPESKVAAAEPLQGQIYTRFVSLRLKRYSSSSKSSKATGSNHDNSNNTRVQGPGLEV